MMKRQQMYGLTQAAPIPTSPREFDPAEIDDLVAANRRGGVVETTMRLRALTEISGLDTATLMALAHVLERDEGYEAVSRFLAVELARSE